MGLQNTFKTNFAGELMKDFEAESGNQYFLFLGKVDPWTTSDNTPDSVVDSVQGTFSAYRNSLIMKRIDRKDIFHIITRYDWISGTVYTEYDDTVDLSASKYYVMTDDYNLYKCIENGGGNKSEAKPTHTEPEIKASGDDGYKWKFLGTVTETARRFLTDEYIPIEYVTNTLEDENSKQLLSQQKAVDGSIDNIKLTETNGSYLMSTPLGSFHDITDKVVGSLDPDYEAGLTMGTTIGFNDTNFTTEQLANISDRIIDYSVFIVSGQGAEVGQLARIKEYWSKSSGGNRGYGDGNLGSNYFVLDKPIERTLTPYGDSPTRFRLLPPIEIWGDGASAEARPEINDSSEISDIVVVNRGQNYTFAEVNIVKEPIDGALASARAIISPRGGHGFNPIKELQSSKLMILMEINGTESGKLRPANEYRQFGIVKNPILNDDTDRIAGSEYVQTKAISISRPYAHKIPYDYIGEDATFKQGNYILGQESFSSAKIETFKPIAGSSSDGIIEVTNVRGSFVSDELDKKQVRFIFATAEAGSTYAGGTATILSTSAILRGVNENTNGTLDFQVGEKVTQHTAPYDAISGLVNGQVYDADDPTTFYRNSRVAAGVTGLTAEGIVKFWDSDTKELIIEVTKNTFTRSSTAGYVRGETAAYVVFNQFQNKGGELIKQYSVGSTLEGGTGSMEIVVKNSEGITQQNYARIMGIGLPLTDENTNPVYRTTTKIILTKNDTSATWSTDAFTGDAVVYQGDGTDTVSGRVVQWFTFGGYTGEMHLCEVKGNYYADEAAGFTTGRGFSGEGIEGSEYTITSIDNSEIIHGSGEVLYIENIRPITRNIEQDEEFKVVIGF